MPRMCQSWSFGFCLLHTIFITWQVKLTKGGPNYFESIGDLEEHLLNHYRMRNYLENVRWFLLFEKLKWNSASPQEKAETSTMEWWLSTTGQNSPWKVFGQSYIRRLSERTEGAARRRSWRQKRARPTTGKLTTFFEQTAKNQPLYLVINLTFQMKKKQKQQMLVDKENERRRLALTESINANSDIFNDDTDSDTPVAGWWKHSNVYFFIRYHAVFVSVVDWPYQWFLAYLISG